MHRERNKCAAEFLGTFVMVFAGTGAMVIDDYTGGTIGHSGVALTWGMVVLAMIYTFGDISGAHINPAVTLGFVAAGRFPISRAPGYIAAQLAGAFAASACMRLLFPNSITLGETLPASSVAQSFGLELILTAILMLTILMVSIGSKEKGITAGIAIGAVVGLEAMFAGPICGASMNPARSLAPAIVGGHLQHLWLYPAATITGAMIAVPLARLTSSPS